MAKEIKATPTLSGKNAKRFLDNMKKSEETSAPESEYKKMVENYNKIKKLVKF